MADRVDVMQPLEPGKHLLAIMDHTGDTKIIWDKNQPDEVDNARETFNRLKKKGYLAFKVEGKDGTKGEVVREFDPNAERMILSPPVVGG